MGAGEVFTFWVVASEGFGSWDRASSIDSGRRVVHCGSCRGAKRRVLMVPGDFRETPFFLALATEFLWSSKPQLKPRVLAVRVCSEEMV